MKSILRKCCPSDGMTGPQQSITHTFCVRNLFPSDVIISAGKELALTENETVRDPFRAGSLASPSGSDKLSSLTRVAFACISRPYQLLSVLSIHQKFLARNRTYKLQQAPCCLYVSCIITGWSLPAVAELSAVVVALYACIREVLRSNPGQARRLFLCCSLSPDQCQDSTSMKP